MANVSPEAMRQLAREPDLLDEVLIRHPRLRVSMMHFGAPLVDEMIAVLGAQPQVYVDIGGNRLTVVTRNREDFEKAGVKIVNPLSAR